MDRVVNVRPPSQAKISEYLWKMKKSSIWPVLGKEHHEGTTRKKTHEDEALVCFHEEGKLIGLIIIPIDDFQANGTQIFSKK